MNYGATLDKYCETDEHGNKESDCYNIKAIPPIIMNSINGMKICASLRPELNFQSIKRPVKKSDQLGYECPVDYQACQEQFLQSES